MTLSTDFIELDRTFHISVANGAKSDGVDLTQPFGRHGLMNWKDLLARPRVVILSGGGSGKTMEIRHRARMLHEEGQPAFFLRIEHVRDDFSGAFDKAAGNHEQFLEWVRSGREGWVFLDSVDEARLKSPEEFEQAIKFVGRVLERVLQRAHIVVTGREAAWRARTDRELIRIHLPYESSSSREAIVDEEPGAPQAEAAEVEYIEEADSDDDDNGNEDSGTADEARKETKESESNAVLIVGFDTLTDKQVETFARAKGMTDVTDFMRSVERKEAQHETARPLDLDGLIVYWNANRKIGNQYELTEASITHRLAEVDSNRAEKTTLTRAQLRHAARILAVANVLMQTPDIRLQDASPDVFGVEPIELLDWTEKDVRTLLMRPLFVASQFGAVRLYVQKVREFLTAEWLHQRLVDHASRARIEALFFRTQYGQEVVVPAMRGVLPWLAMLDADVLARVRRVAPEVMFEGGDPSRLPLEMRRELLTKACAQLANTPWRHGLTDFQSVQRFAAPDLADHINSLIAIYRSDDEVLYFLMRMVWQGEIAEVLPEAKHIACNATNFNVRVIAMRALGILGKESDLLEMRAALLSGAAPPEREWVAEAIESLPRNADGVSWLLAACVRSKLEQRYSIDPLPEAIEAYTADLQEDLLPSLVNGLQMLVAPAAGPDDDDGDRRPQPYDWLIGAAITALDRLVVAKNCAAFQPSAMTLLLRIPVAVRFGDKDDRKDSEQLADRVGAWDSLNHALLWADVTGTRARRQKKNGESLTDVWGVGIFGHYWRLGVGDFDYIENQISAQPLIDDRLVALSAAHMLHRTNGQPPSWRQRLKRRVKGVPELEAALAVMLGPQSEQMKKWRRQEVQRKRRSSRKAIQREVNTDRWRAHLQANLDALRTPLPGGGIRQSQYYLSTRMRDFDKSASRWTDGKWRALIPEYGTDVAKAFHDGAIAFWRTNTPDLLSTGAAPNSTPHTTVFGLTGLLFEALESRDWASQLTAQDATLAARYAMHELNGFPPWLPRLFAVHPDPVIQVALGEVEYELRTATAIDSPSHYVLSDVSSVGSWFWPRLAPLLLKKLDPPPKSAHHLRQLLTILSGSDVSGADIAALARQHAEGAADELAAIWFAGWAGVEPDQALPALAAYLSAISDKPRQVHVAMHFLVALTGGRRERRVAREAYRTVPHLTTLFLLMHQYILESEDLERAGKGVYSPSLRDDAQEARDALLASLRDTSGQEAYFALQQIAAEHPSQRGRAWATHLAQARAVADADRPGWSVSQAREFLDKLENTPRNHQELQELAIERLIDFKHFLEHGETSIAAVLLTPEETAVRNVVADWCKTRGLSRYVIAQEEEFADKKRTDIRFTSMAFDNPVPVELKLSNRWSGAELVERLENQLCNDYLRDKRSSRGIFLLMDQGGRPHWDLPDGSRVSSVAELTQALQAHWASVARNFPHVHAVQVIGIDLTLRAKPMGRSVAKNVGKKSTKKTTNSAAGGSAKKATKKSTTKIPAKNRIGATRKRTTK